jgi:formylglycine-generating enzyme required for sulfatase activity/tRNA A-37 threonylcarbamoyl transferase component Bud32
MSTGIADLAPGATFAGQFRVVKKLAQGGMGAVYVAEQLTTGRQRALKLMHPALVSSRELRDKFTLEARVGAKIASEHVVEVVAAGVDPSSGAPWLAMELLTGEDLSTAIKKRGAFEANETAAILAQICHALGAAHQAGIVHRDLKPENVFLAESRRAQESYTVKVLDFGIAKVLEAARGSNTGAIGSPLWMAPEQTERNADISPATDVWALALVAFSMLTGRSFWLSADANEMALGAFLRELVLEPIPKASARAAELGVTLTLPPGFDEWFERALVRDRSLRYASAVEAYAAFCERLGIRTQLSGTGPVKMPVTSTGPVQPRDGHVRIGSGAQGGLPETPTDAARLASARTLPHAETPADDHGHGHGHGHEHLAADEGVPHAVPVEGPSPKLLALGGIAAAVAIAVGAIVILRGGPSRSAMAAEDASAAATGLPFCPKGMVRVPGADVTIGTDQGPKEEQPAHAVKVTAFCIDVTEVSVAEYKDCVDKKGCPGGHAQAEWAGITKEDRAAWSAFCNEPRANRNDHPMNCVSFDDAAAFCTWAGKKLPSEEQWEYAARGADSRAYPWGHEPPSPKRVNGCDEGCAKAARRQSETIARRLEGDDRYESTSPTGAFPEGVSAFGSFDMAGNVAEWVDAPYCNYGQNTCGTAARVLRGGSWTSELEADLRSTARFKASPTARQPDVGFRCVK